MRRSPEQIPSAAEYAVVARRRSCACRCHLTDAFRGVMGERPATSPADRRCRVGPLLAASLVAIAGCGFLPLSRTSRKGAEVLESAPKPQPRDSVFDGCGPGGSRPDYVLNERKNRIDDADSAVAVPWVVIARLPWPRAVGYRFRNQWSGGETRETARYEGAPVQVEGYLAGYRLEVPEPPNCYARAAEDRDFHMWLVEKPHDAERRAVVVEITPRLRVRHPGWTEAQLAALVARQIRVRTRGWLMLDQMHPEEVGFNRITLWEIHPITRVEWQTPDSSWVRLDTRSPASGGG
jgi:hypothetical protein